MVKMYMKKIKIFIVFLLFGVNILCHSKSLNDMPTSRDAHKEYFSMGGTTKRGKDTQLNIQWEALHFVIDTCIYRRFTDLNVHWDSLTIEQQDRIIESNHMFKCSLNVIVSVDIPLGNSNFACSLRRKIKDLISYVDSPFSNKAELNRILSNKWNHWPDDDIKEDLNFHDQDLCIDKLFGVGWGGSFDRVVCDEIKIRHLTNKFVTLEHYSYDDIIVRYGGTLNCGGGMYITYLAENFRELDYSFFKNLESGVFKKLLGAYIVRGVHVHEDLDIDRLPLPTRAPTFLPNGVCFRYYQGEIADKFDGDVLITIPYREMRPFMTTEALTLLADLPDPSW